MVIPLLKGHLEQEPPATKTIAVSFIGSTEAGPTRKVGLCALLTHIAQRGSRLWTGSDLLILPCLSRLPVSLSDKEASHHACAPC